MTREELVAKKLELETQIDNEWKKGKKASYNKVKKLANEVNHILADLDEIDGLIYIDEEWIDKKFYTSEKSLADARLGLAKMLSKLPGVKVEEKAGVQTVKVTTKWKIYYFIIHAHYQYEELEWEEHTNLSGGKYASCTKGRNVYTAWLDKAAYPYWCWKY